MNHIYIGVQRAEETQRKYPIDGLYKRLFEAILKLARDPDQVTRQLFLTLTFQIIHWFTNNTIFESPNSMVLLNAIMVKMNLNIYMSSLLLDFS